MIVEWVNNPDLAKVMKIEWVYNPERPCREWKHLRYMTPLNVPPQNYAETSHNVSINGDVNHIRSTDI